MLDISLPKFMKKNIHKKEKISHFSMGKDKESSKVHKKETSKTNNNLIKCKACGESISKNAKVCPNCGEPAPKPSKWRGPLILIGVLYSIGFVGYLINGTPEPTKSATYKKTYTPKHIDKRQKTLKGGYYACTSEALFDEIINARINKDNLAIGHLLSRGCVLTKAGVKMSIIDLGMGTTKIRAYSGSDSVILYTNTENVYY